MKKRMVALMLGLVMLASSITGCSNSENVGKVEESSSGKEETKSSVVAQVTETTSNSDDAEIAAEHFAGTELTIAVFRRSTDTTESFNEKLIFKMAEEATGIHVNWIELDQAVASERVNVMLADKEQPDIYLGVLSDSLLMANASMFYDLSEEGLLETYAPHVLEIYDEIKADGADVLKMLEQPDGSIRSLATNSAVSPTSDAVGIPVINQAWLDKVGKPIPTTADELYDVLCAFRDTDMNGNGIKDEIPLSFCNSNNYANVYQYLNSFGIASGQKVNHLNPFLMLKNGEVTPTVDTEEWRAYLEFMHKLISEGLVDKEGFSQTTEQFNAKLAENKVGVYTCWTPVTGDGLDFVAMRPVQALEGVEPVLHGNDGFFFGWLGGFAITKDSENVEAALHWWDYLHSSAEIMNTAYCGEKDVVWFEREDGSYYDDTSTDVAKANYNFNALYTGACPLRPYRVFTGKQGERFEMVNEMRDLLVDYKDDIQVGFVDPLAQEELTFIQNDLLSYIKNYSAEAMMNGVTDASWKEFVDGLKDYQYYEWIDWYQRYVDGEF